MKCHNTLAKPAMGHYKEKGSKFIAYAFSVSSEEEVKAHLASLKSKYPDARHHCFAYILADAQHSERAYDDGEPNNSAGVPILNQIRSFKLSNVLVVVVRYFGGIKLGVSGLVNAYKTATKEALSSGSIIEQFPQSRLSLVYPYEQTKAVKQMLQCFEAEVIQQSFTDICQLEIKFKSVFEEDLKAYLEDFPSIETIVQKT